MSTTAKASLKPIQSKLFYGGDYVGNSFELLAPPIPLYKALVKHLAEFGCTIHNLAFESPSLGDTHVVCNLPDLNAIVRVRINRVEVDCWKYDEIGRDVVYRLIVATWAAVQDADETVEIATHVVDLTTVAEVQGMDCATLMCRYVVTPQQLGLVDAGVGFFARPAREGEKWVNLILDRVYREDRQISVKATMGLPSRAIELDALALSVDQTVAEVLDKVGLEFTSGQQT